MQPRCDPSENLPPRTDFEYFVQPFERDAPALRLEKDADDDGDEGAGAEEEVGA